MTQQDMVLVWCQRESSKDQILLILKDRPQWQAGRLNLPGGKIEVGESPEEATIREVKEETGYDLIAPPVIFGKMIDNGLIIYCVKAVVPSTGDPEPREGETEKVMWMNWSDACIDDRLLANLRFIVPMMMCGVADWIVENVQQGHQNFCQMKITMEKQWKSKK